MSDKAKKQFAADIQNTYEEMFNPRFADSGRKGSISEQLDAVIAAPARVGINELQKGNWNAETARKILQAIGQDPENAPTGIKIAEQTGIENPYAAAAIASAVDLGSDLITPGPGIKGSVAKVAKTAQTAKALRGIQPASFEKPLATEMLKVTPASSAELAVKSIKKPIISNAAAKAGEMLGGSGSNKYVDALESAGTATGLYKANSAPASPFGAIKWKP